LERRIVSSRSDLHRKQREHNFPYPVKISDRTAWWPAAEVNAWIRERAALRKPKARSITA
jgi:predicted DNA-binding transcriptional regulator AlpA